MRTRYAERQTALVEAVHQMLYRAMEMTFWLSQAQAVVAEVEGR